MLRSSSAMAENTTNEKLTHRRAGINIVLETPEPNAPLFQQLHQINQPLRGAAQTVQLPDDEGVVGIKCRLFTIDVRNADNALTNRGNRA